MWAHSTSMSARLFAYVQNLLTILYEYAKDQLIFYTKTALPTHEIETKNKLDHAICFSGGGLRAYTCAVGQMEALRNSKRLAYRKKETDICMTGVSGGAWFVTCYGFTNYLDKELFLPYIEPTSLQSTDLSRNSLLTKRITNAPTDGIYKYITPFTLFLFPSWLYTHCITHRFLYPFNINPRSVYGSYIVRYNRPFPITNCVAESNNTIVPIYTTPYQTGYKKWVNNNTFIGGRWPIFLGKGMTYKKAILYSSYITDLNNGVFESFPFIKYIFRLNYSSAGNLVDGGYYSNLNIHYPIKKGYKTLYIFVNTATPLTNKCIDHDFAQLFSEQSDHGIFQPSDLENIIQKLWLSQQDGKGAFATHECNLLPNRIENIDINVPILCHIFYLSPCKTWINSNHILQTKTDEHCHKQFPYYATKSLSLSTETCNLLCMQEAWKVRYHINNSLIS